MTAPPRPLTLAERNAAKTRELGKAGRIAPVPYREGDSSLRRCTACGHITRFHWYDSKDRRFRGHLGRRWCQICTAFCPTECCTTGRAHPTAETRALAPAERRTVPEVPAHTPTLPAPSEPVTGGETTTLCAYLTARVSGRDLRASRPTALASAPDTSAGGSAAKAGATGGEPA